MSSSQLLPVLATPGPIADEAPAASPSRRQQTIASLKSSATGAVLSAVGPAVTAAGVNLLMADGFGYRHQAMRAPGIALTAVGAVTSALGQWRLPRVAVQHAAYGLAWATTQAGVALNQLGDSHYHPASGHIERNHGIFAAGALLAGAGGAAVLATVVGQWARPSWLGTLTCAGLAMVASGGILVGNGAGSGADQSWERAAGFATLLAGFVAAAPAVAKLVQRQAPPAVGA